MKLSIRMGWVLLAVLMVGPVQAGNVTVQKWTDSLGHVHFGDQPPTAANTEEMVIKTGGPSDAGAGNASAGKDKAPKQDSEACVTARKQLHDYEAAPFLYETDPQGKKRILPDEQRQELLEGVRQRVSSECNE